MRKKAEYTIVNPGLFRQKLLSWAVKYENIAFYNSYDYADKNTGSVAYHSFECLAAIGKIVEIKGSGTDGFLALKEFHSKVKDWTPGFFSYDLKNQVENLQSENEDFLEFPDFHFFQPLFIFEISGSKLIILYLEEKSSKSEIDKIFEEISIAEITTNGNGNKAKINRRFNKKEYIETVNKLKEHIQKGDIYEVNFCQEFYSSNAKIDPVQTYFQLVEVSPTPFSCYYQLEDKYLLSASPERFMKKQGSKIISQPIKGTIKRGKDKYTDNVLKCQLYNDVKERAENVMIVDLVRNDLSRTAKSGTVKVEELFGIYTFEQVHQMISTVVSELDSKWHFSDCIKNAFPMGSMTGAPKIRAVDLIEKYERSKRGLFSGAVGYITPNGDFDFNVVIRSILYNAGASYLSFMTGGAITSKSVAENEYDECLVKAQAMMMVLENE